MGWATAPALKDDKAAALPLVACDNLLGAHLERFKRKMVLRQRIQKFYLSEGCADPSSC